MNDTVMTLEQRMTLKAILESENPVYKINRISFVSYESSVRMNVDGKSVNIQPNGKITERQNVEIEL